MQHFKSKIPTLAATLIILALDPLWLRLLLFLALTIWHYWRWFSPPKTTVERQEKALAHLASALDVLDTPYEREVFMACCEREINSRSRETNPAN